MAGPAGGGSAAVSRLAARNGRSPKGKRRSARRGRRCPVGAPAGSVGCADCPAVLARWACRRTRCTHWRSFRSDMLRQVSSRSAPAARRPSRGGPGQRPGPSPGTNSPQDCLCPGSVRRRPTSRPHRAPPAARNQLWHAGRWPATLVSKDLGRPVPGCVCGAEERSHPRVADRRKASRRANRVRGPVPGWAAQQHARERPSYSRARGWRAPQGTPRSGAPQSQPGAGRPRSSR